MGFFTGISQGFKLFTDSLVVLVKKPVFLIPLFFSWFVFAGVVLYIRYYFDFPDFTQAALYLYLLIFLITFIISLANVMMLELVQQIESGKEMSFGEALSDTIVNILKIIPVAAIWAFIWVIIIILRSLTSKKRGNKAEPSARDAARTLGGASGSFSFIKLGLSMIEKVVRMTVFLTLPAIAWENRGPFSAFGTAFRIIKKHPLQFITTYTMTGAAALLMALPLIPVFILDDIGMNFSPAFWTVIIIYECIIWTLGIYLEQMSVGLLYLWHLKWQKNGSKGDLSTVKRPHLLDNVYEFTTGASIK